MPPSYEVQVVTSPGEFAALRAEWGALLERSTGTLFQSWEWLHTWWTHLGRGRLWLLLARREGRLAGIAPLFISRYGGTGLRRVGFLGTGSSDYLQFLVDAAEAEEATAALLEYVAAERRRWDFCDWQQIPEDTPLAALPAPPGVCERRIVQETCPYVPLPGSWREFTGGLGRKLRGNLGYYRRLIERDFEAEWLTATNGTTEQGMEAFFRLHQRRWNQRLLPGAFMGRRQREFHQAAAAALQERGWLRLHLLRLNGREEAALYCFHFRGKGYYYLGGFEPAKARYSLGTALTAQAIERAIEEGAAEFDFLRGDEPYKYAWRAVDRHNWRWLWWKPGGVSRLAPLLNDLERAAERRIKAFARSRR
jgi:CelD/BcsL family acetyltransferase involved in cellulose biosynthesis